MGDWGVNTFQNDWALDWTGDLRESGDVSNVQAALNLVVEHGGTRHYSPTIFGRLIFRRPRTERLAADVARHALAAAEIVATWLGYPPTSLPDGLSAWVAQHSSSFRPEFLPLALRAVRVIKTDSELKSLWEEGDATEWRNVIEDLERRLQEQKL